MSTINELYLEIEDLKNQIDEEPRKRLKRKLMIESKINELEEEKRRSGLHSDFASVQQYNSQIKKLKHELSGGNVYDYESEIKVLKRKISSILINYFKNGYSLDDIFQKDDVPQNIQEEWLSKCNFGKTTGILFVDELDNDKEHNWRYFNPILEIEYKSKTLDDLEYQITSYKDVLLILNKNLANEAHEKDFKLSQTKINAHIIDLKSCDDASDIFKSLEIYKNRFTKTQIKNLTEVIISNPNICNFAQGFKNILTSNNEDNDETYEKIIDSRLNHLNKCDSSLYPNLFKDLNILADKFNKNQINSFYNIIQDIKYFSCCYKFILNILKNETELYEEFNGKINEMKIDAKLNALAEVTYDYRAAREILDDLYIYYSDDFNKTQLIKLCNIAIDNDQVYNCIYCKSSLRYILTVNKDKIDKKLYEETILKNGL